MGFSGLLIDQRGKGAIRRMAALAVREHFDVCKDCRLGLLVRVKVLQMDECGF
jgi:hypothetical protein